jgi:methionyl-tRNA formyltransferase
MRIIFFGTPEFAVPSLRKLIEAGHDIPAVVTQPDKVKGRGHVLSEPPVKVLAKQRGLTVLQPNGIRSDEFASTIISYAPELIIVVAYGKIIPPALLKIPRYGCVNVHASLLPKYRGAAPIQWSIIKGEEKTGVTTMQMDEGLDTGDILEMAEAPIAPDDTAATLSARLSVMGADLLMATIDGIATGSVRPIPQQGAASYAPVLKKEDGCIDWERPARDIFNLVRGTYPWPGAYCYLSGERVAVLRAGVVEGRGLPGQIEKIQSDDVFVGTGEGLLVLAEVKPDGRKVMTAGAFVRGRRLKEGAFFEKRI